jgi:RNA polymerase sigma factor (sigma-70 family)
MRATTWDETSLVVAAQAGDPRALDELVGAYLPLVYTVVRRALSGHPDVDDIVQETMLRALRELRVLRAPESFRPWLVAIAMRQVSTHLHRRHVATERATSLDELAGEPDPDADFEGFTVLRVELSNQRRQVVRASRWLDPDDRALLSLWWLEIAGELSRTELAAASGMGVAHAGVRVQRMRRQLEVSRSLVAALDARPSCARLETVVASWNGVPSPLWRKRIVRHTRSCAVCARTTDGMIPPERLLVGFALLPVPMTLACTVPGEGALPGTAVGAAAAAPAAGSLGSTGAAAGSGVGLKAGLFGQLAQAVGAHPVAAAIAAGMLVAGVAATAITWPTGAPPGVVTAPTSAPAVIAPPSAALAPSPAPNRPSPTAAGPSNVGSRPLALGPVSLESVNGVGLVSTTADGLGVLERVGGDSTGPARRRATFEVVRGLADSSCVSLRAQDGRYLRHSSWRLRLSQDEGTRLFRGDATFCARAGSVPGSVSLESANYPGGFLRHSGDELWVDPLDGTAAAPADASFLARPPLAG